MAASIPKATFNNTVHRYEFPEEFVTFVLDRFDQGRDGALNCEIEITGRTGQILSPKRTNLLSEQTMTRLANTLTIKTKGQDLDWGVMLEVVAKNSINRYRQGDPSVDLTKISGWRERPRFMLWPFLESAGDTIIFADGGSGKSTVALIIATMVATGFPILPDVKIFATGNVLYLDYESDDITHAERLQAIRAAWDPPLDVPEGAIIYKRMYAPLHETVDDLLKEIAQKRIVMVVVDSIGRARGGAPEGSEETLRLFNALARLQVPRLLIDHLSKDAIFNDRGNTRPIGSIYTHNNARLTWSLTAAEQMDMEGGLHSIQMVNHKNNNGKLQGRRTYSLNYYADDEERLTMISVDELDPSTVPSFLKMLPLWKRCQAMLHEHGEATTDELAEMLGAKKAEVERNLAGQPGVFFREVREGVAYWQAAVVEDTVTQTHLGWPDEPGTMNGGSGTW